MKSYIPLLVLVGALLSSCCSGVRTQTAAARTTTSASSAPAATSSGGEILRGQASYYANSLSGRPTASGEKYDPNKLTAANRTLPLGTRLRVTRVDTGKSVIVKVNDRGPFGRRTRILDLSRAAAKELDMISAGVVQVQAEVLK